MPAPPSAGGGGGGGQAATTIRTCVRIRPCSSAEEKAFPGPLPVQAAPGEVRLFSRCDTTRLVRTVGRSACQPAAVATTCCRDVLAAPKPSSRPASPAGAAQQPVPATAAQQALRQQAAQLAGGAYESYKFRESVMQRESCALHCIAFQQQHDSPALCGEAKAAAEQQRRELLRACCLTSAHVFGPDASTEAVYTHSGCREIVEAVLGGCNGALTAACTCARQQQPQQQQQLILLVRLMLSPCCRFACTASGR